MSITFNYQWQREIVPMESLENYILKIFNLWSQKNNLRWIAIAFNKVFRKSMQVL